MLQFLVRNNLLHYNWNWNPPFTAIALVAQMVERKTLNLVVVGSSPTEGAFF